MNCRVCHVEYSGPCCTFCGSTQSAAEALEMAASHAQQAARWLAEKQKPRRDCGDFTQSLLNFCQRMADEHLARQQRWEALAQGGVDA